MKIVVAGGTGFIGEPLVERLVARGDDVVVLSRNPAKVTIGRGVAWDARTQGPWSSDVASADVIINLAGENIGEGGRWSEERKRRIIASRLDATHALVEALRNDSRTRAFLNASAIGYYGSRGDEILDESSSPGSDFLAEVCRRWEEAAREVESLARLVIVRIGLVLAPDGGALGKLLLPFRLFAGGKFGSGRQWMSWITRDDLLRLFVWAIDHGSARGVFNGTAPNPVRNEEFAKTLGGVMNRPAILPAPAFALKLALGEMGDALLLSSQRALPLHATSEGFVHENTALEPALRKLLVT